LGVRGFDNLYFEANNIMKSTVYLDSCEHFARAMVSMGQFMSSGRTYEETYQHGADNTTDPQVRQIWLDMLDIANERARSPLEALKNRDEWVTPWLLNLFTVGVLAGVETIWIRGGQAFLEVARMLRENPRPDASLRKKLITDLAKAGSGLGLAADFSSSASGQFIETVTKLL
jgi:hypothetical protein